MRNPDRQGYIYESRRDHPLVASPNLGYNFATPCWWLVLTGLFLAIVYMIGV